MKEIESTTLRRRIGAASAALTVAGGGVLLLGLSPASPAHAAAASKWFVCKYVGTPGVNETLQTGQNPISVDENAIGESPVVAGTYFNDSQGRSYVLVADTGQPEPPVTDCPPPGGPTPTETVPVTPTETVTITETPTSSGALPTSEAATSAAEASSQAAPLPVAVEAGKHSVSSTSIALGGLLMAAGAGGLAVAARRPRKHGAA